MRRFVTACLFLLAAATASAQYASTLRTVAESPRLTTREAIWLAGSVSGSLNPGTTVDAAPEALRQLGLIDERLFEDERLDEQITLAAFSRLLMRLEELPGGFWYGERAAPFVAFYYLRRIGVIGSDAWPSDPVAGGEAVDLVRRYLAVLRARGGER